MLETILTSVPAFLFALGVIVFVHEGGHYLMAKLFGVRVLVFSLGFGQRAWGFQRGGTDYRVSWIPLGGYVRMAGEMPDERSARPDDFLNQARWKRILVYLAGPLMNVVLSVALIAGVFMHGIEMQALQDIPAVIGAIEEGSAGEEAGLRVGDRVLTVDGKPVDKWKDVIFDLSTSPEQPVVLGIERDGQSFDVTVTPHKVERYEYGDAGVFPQIQLRFVKIFKDTPAQAAGFEPGDEVRRIDGQDLVNVNDFVEYVSTRPGQELEIEVLRGDELLRIAVVPAEFEDGKGRIGVQLGPYRPLGFQEAIVESVRFNVEIVHKSVLLLGKLFTNELTPKSTLSGPIEIASYSGEAARRSFEDLLYFMGFLSISIAFMNLLPIPILDGGHIAILLVESVMRRDLSLVVKERITQVGFVMLMTLMAMVIFFDLSKNLPGLFGS